jgi:hypothetical protein
MKFVALLLVLLAVLWYGGAFLGWFHVDYKRGRGPKDAGEWIAFLLGWIAIIAGILFLLSKALG